MSLHLQVLKIFLSSTEEDFDSGAFGKGSTGTMATLSNLLPLIILVIFLGIVAVIGYQVCHCFRTFIKAYHVRIIGCLLILVDRSISTRTKY